MLAAYMWLKKKILKSKFCFGGLLQVLLPHNPRFILGHGKGDGSPSLVTKSNWSFPTRWKFSINHHITEQLTSRLNLRLCPFLSLNLLRGESLAAKTLQSVKSLIEGQNSGLDLSLRKFSIKSLFACCVPRPILRVGWNFRDFLFPSLKL